MSEWTWKDQATGCAQGERCLGLMHLSNFPACMLRKSQRLDPDIDSLGEDDKQSVGRGANSKQVSQPWMKPRDETFYPSLGRPQNALAEGLAHHAEGLSSRIGDDACF